MRQGWALLGAAAAVIVALVAGAYHLLRALKDTSGVAAEAWRIVGGLPPHLQRYLMAVSLFAVVIAIVLTPIALAETRSLREYARLEETLRRERPDDVMTPYHGEEGDGVAFDGPEGRLLLLRAPQGIGEPRVVRYPPPETPAEALPAPPGAPDAA